MRGGGSLWRLAAALAGLRAWFGEVRVAMQLSGAGLGSPPGGLSSAHFLVRGTGGGSGSDSGASLPERGATALKPSAVSRRGHAGSTARKRSLGMFTPRPLTKTLLVVHHVPATGISDNGTQLARRESSALKLFSQRMHTPSMSPQAGCKGRRDIA